MKSALRRAHHIVRMTVIPHKKNNYRPHLIRRYGLVAIAFAVVGMQFGYNNALTGSVLGLKLWNWPIKAKRQTK